MTSSDTIDSITTQSDSATTGLSAAIDSSATDAGQDLSIASDDTVAATIGSDITLSTKIESSFALLQDVEFDCHALSSNPIG